MMIFSSKLSFLLLLCLRASLVTSTDGEGEIGAGGDFNLTSRIVGGSDASPGAYPFFGKYYW